MAKFEVLVSKINSVTDHPNADRLSLIQVDGYTTISAKLDDGSHRYRPGGLAVYVPEGAVVPEFVLKTYGFWDEAKGKGFLAGPKGDRVKAVKLRGVLSQGILLQATGPGARRDHDPFCLVAQYTLDDAREYWFNEGQDVAAEFGITKYEPPIPIHMAGEVESIGWSFNYDIENLKKYPHLFEGKFVSVTEKLHGTLCAFGIVDGVRFVTSKGMLQKGQGLKFNENNAGNLYVRTAVPLLRKCVLLPDVSTTVFFGEIVGTGVQDLHYGIKVPEFRLFDIWSHRFLSPVEMSQIAHFLEIPTVPILWSGEFNRAKLDELVGGKSTIFREGIREGIVIKTDSGEFPELGGRGALKHVSEEYLTRKGEVTEFQ